MIARRFAGELASSVGVVVEAELGARARSSVCSPTHGTRVSGPSAIFDSFTGLPGTSTGSSTPSVRGISTSMLRAATCGSAITSAAWLLGPAAMPGRGQLVRGLELRHVDAHASTAGRITVSRCGAQPCAGREARVVLPLRVADELGELLELVLAPDLHDEVAVGRAEPVADHLQRLAGLGPHAHRPEVRDDVGHRDHRVEHRDVDVLPLAGAGRGAGARRARRSRRTARELMSPSAPTGIVTGGSSGPLVLVDARHRLDDRRVRRPVAVRRRRPCCRSPETER